jgi:hypothetical protein
MYKGKVHALVEERLLLLGVLVQDLRDGIEVLSFEALDYFAFPIISVTFKMLFVLTA